MFNLCRTIGPSVLMAILMTLALPAQAERAKPVEAPDTCASFTDARKLIGKKQCVRGTVLRVERSSDDASFLNFCEDARACSFTVVVFAEDLHHVGDLNSLIGRTIEISGKVRDYEGQAEIVLQDAEQLGRELKKLPPAPKEFDVEERGRFSPGKFHATKVRRERTKKAKLPSTLDVEEGAEE